MRIFSKWDSFFLPWDFYFLNTAYFCNRISGLKQLINQTINKMSTKSLNIKDLARRAMLTLLLAIVTTASAWAQGLSVSGTGADPQIPILNPSDEFVASLGFISEIPTCDNGEVTNWYSGQNYNNLVDGNINNNYGLSSANPWVEFHYASPITPKGYALWTAQDTEKYPARNPKSWTIKAKNSGDADWTTLVTVDNSSGDKLPVTNVTCTVFALDNSTAYQYFRFEAVKDDTYGFQLAELQFCTLQPIIADLVIRSAADWNTFAQNVNNGTDDYQGKVVKLAADISVTTMVGTNETPFAGTFDGDGHTMNLAINTTGTGGGHPNIAAAPFRYVNGATFKNIKLTGTVTRTDYPSDADVSLGGLIGILSQYRSATVIGCRSSVSINYDFTWDSGNFTTGHMGGFIGRSDGNATITDCLFDGTLAGRPLHQGGFVGYLCWGGVTFNNCLMSGTSSANSTYQGNFYGRDNNGGAGSLNNCYYTNIIGSQGSYTTATGETLRAQLGYGWIVNDSSAVVPCMALQLPADANNITTIAAANGTRYDKVILTGRTLYRDGSWNTLCLPFNLSSFSGTPLEGATVKTLSSSAYSNGVLTLSFTSVSSIEAGKPYIVKWSSGSNIENPMFTNVTISNATVNVVTTYANFLGSYAPFDSYSYLYDAHNTAGNGMNGALSISDPAPVSGQNVYWYTNSGHTQSVNTIPFNADGNVTLYGLWSGTFTIHYDLDGGTMEGNPTTYTIQSNITLVAPTREGYTFIGWTGSNGDTPQISVTIPAGSTGDLYYTAHWVPRVEYVEYNTSTKQYETKLVTTNFTTVTSSTTSLGNGWYVVTGNVTVNDPIGIGNDITARLVLCDGATLTAKNRINMERTSTLIIYGQSNGTGKLDAKSTKYNYNAIGTPQDQRGGTVIIHSGTVVATAVGNASAAIGGFGNYGHGGTVRIYGGNVTAKSTGEWGSGIGGAGWYGEGGTVEILGGTVVVEGGEHGKAIGGTTGGASASDGELSLGNVRVYASANASTPVNQGDRQSTCRSQYARIEKCTQHVGSGSRCQYCNASIYHVTYNSNKATSGTVPTDAIAYKLGQTATVLGNTGNLERTGYTFMGWNTEADGSGITYTAGATFTISDNTTLYAKWTPILVLANNLNNSSAISEAAASSKYYNVTLADRTLYCDGTWNTLVLPFNIATLDGTPLEGFTVKTLQSSTLVNGELTLNFANANSIEAGKPYIVKWDQTPINNLVNPVFKEVLISNATSNLETTYADFIGSYAPITDDGLLLDAHNPNGNAMHAAIRAKLEWYSVSCYTQPNINYPATSIPFSGDGNVTLWTICIPIDYPITYNLNGGTNHPGNPATYNIASATITLQAPTKTNYIFGGWFDNAECTGDAVTTIDHGSHGNVTLYAKWLTAELELANNDDNSSAISEAAASGKYHNVTLADHTIYRDGDWNTLVLPFNLATLTGTPLEGLSVKTLESSTYSDGTLTLSFSDATSIEAGKPYIVKDNADLVIRTAADWNTFANNVNNGIDTYQGKVVKLAADITVTTMVGTVSGSTQVNAFKGTFDGCGHTLNVSITDKNNQGTAPFRYISGVTIKNLKTTGTVTGNLHCAGLVGFAAHNTTNSIQNCEVAVSVVCNGGNHSHCGGILGHGLSSTTTITDCLFSGSITGTTTATGIIYGWGSGGGTHRIVNCLSAGTYKSCSGIDLLKKNNGTQTITNCYRKTSGGSQGTDASGMSNETLVGNLGSGWEIRDGQVVPKMADNIVNLVFSNVLISDANANISTDHANFIGSYAPITDAGLLLDAHNPDGDAMHAALSISEPTRDDYTFGGWCTDAGQTMPLSTTIPFTADGTVTLYAKWLTAELELANNGNNSSAINAAAVSGKYYDVMLADRTIYRDGEWNTLCLPFNLATLSGTPLEGLTVKTLESSTCSDGTLTMNFSDATSIEAGKPYIVKDNADLVIRSAADWNTFATNVNSGTTYQGKVVKLAADISVTTMVGNSSNPFKGTFDGCGHTLTVSISGGNNTAPFSCVGAASIRNLKVDGSVTTTNGHPCSGLVGFTNGALTITNCVISVTFTSGYKGNAADGGILGLIDNNSGSVTIEDCAFMGKILTTNGTTDCGGIVGWRRANGVALTIKNCLYAPTALAVGETEPTSSCKTICRYSDPAPTITNCYYTRTLGDSQGTDASGMSNETLASNLGSGWEIRDGQVVPKMNHDIVNPVFENVLISDATANISTDHANFIGSYAPITDAGLLLDAHNPNGDAMHAALRITLSEPTREGYTFGGWCTDAGQTTPLSTTIPFTANGNVTLYGKWTPHTYTVRFNKNHNDVSGTMADQPFTYGAEQALTANTFTAPTGYLFAGWSTTTDGAVEYTDGQSVSNLATEQDAVVNLYAIWGYAYTISYDLAGGNADNPTYYSELSGAITLVNPTRNGYTFTGWTGTDLDEPTMTVTIPTGSTGNRSYTATWSPIAYNITYNLGGGTLSEGESNPTSYNIESAEIALVNPIREDYTFLGWTGSNGNVPQKSVTIATGSTGDLSYNANWIQYSTDTYLAYNTTTQEFETLTAPVYTTVTSGTTTMNNGWYAVKENTTISSRITVTGTVNLILFDNATLTASQGLNVTQGVALNIFGQTNGTGVLTASCGDDYMAAIGGNKNQAGGTVTIHGGTVRATVGDYGYGAGIGGGLEGNGGTVTIYGGTVRATVGAHGYGAGIGGSRNGNGGTVTINGGTVTATISDYGYGAGIGGGIYGNGGTVTINGGTVTATVGAHGYGAGIGGSRNGNGGTVTINGGTVTATISDYGYGAGIGGGLEGNGGTVTINGGIVRATVGNRGYGAGIGGGYNGSGGTVAIHGGTVTATVGNNGYGAGIGGGYNGSGGTLTLGDMRVYASAKATTPVASGNRVSTCCTKYAKLELCTDHNGKNGYCTYCDAHVILVNNDAEAAAGEKNTDVISTWNGTTTDVILQDRTLYKDGDWNTLCVPFDVVIEGSPLDGADVRALSSASLIGDELTLNFTKEGEVTTIEAGKPYIIKWKRAEDYVDDDEHNLVNPVFRNVTIKSDMNNFVSTDGKVTFKGTYARIDWAEETPNILFVGAQNQLHWPQEGAYLNAFRAYFELADGEQARSFNLNFGEEASDIVAIDNSQLTIHNEADAWYTVNGVKLSGKPTKKGLYIHNGKKVVIK